MDEEKKRLVEENEVLKARVAELEDYVSKLKEELFRWRGTAQLALRGYD